MAFDDDIALLREFRDHGSEEAFEALVSRYAGLVYATALRQTRRVEQAKDVTQEVFVALARKAAKLSDSGSIGGWLHRAVMLEAAKAKRTEARRLRKMDNYREHLERSVKGHEFQPELMAAIDDGLLRLPDRDRRLLSWRFLDGLSFAQIAEKLGKSENACHKMQSRALAKLRKNLVRAGFAMPAGAVSAAMRQMASSSCPASLATIVVKAAMSFSAAQSTTVNAPLGLSFMYLSKKKILASAFVVLLAAGIGIQQWRMGRLNEIADAGDQKLERLRVVIENERLKRAGGEKPRPVDQTDLIEIGELLSEAQKAFEKADLVALGEIVRRIGRLPSPMLHELLDELDNVMLDEGLRRILAEAALQVLADEEPSFAIDYALDHHMIALAAQFVRRWATDDPESAMAWYNGNVRASAREDGQMNAVLEGIVEAVAEADPEWAIDLIAQLGEQDIAAVMNGLGSAFAKSGLSSDQDRFVNLAAGLKTRDQRVSVLKHFGIAAAHYQGFEKAASYLLKLEPQIDSAEWNSVMIDSVGINLDDRTAMRLDWVARQSSDAHLPDNIARMAGQLTTGRHAEFDFVEEWLEGFGESPVRDKGIDVLALSLTPSDPARAFAWARKIMDDSLREERMKVSYHTWNAVDGDAARTELARLGITVEDFGYTGSLVKTYE